MPAWITSRQAAAILGASKDMVCWYVRRGQLRARRAAAGVVPGRPRWEIRRRDVERLRDERLDRAERMAKAKKMVAAGESMATVARVCKLNKTTPYQWRAKLQVKGLSPESQQTGE